MFCDSVIELSDFSFCFSLCLSIKHLNIRFEPPFKISERIFRIGFPEIVNMFYQSYLELIISVSNNKIKPYQTLQSGEICWYTADIVVY